MVLSLQKLNPYKFKSVTAPVVSSETFSTLAQEAAPALVTTDRADQNIIDAAIAKVYPSLARIHVIVLLLPPMTISYVSDVVTPGTRDSTSRASLQVRTWKTMCSCVVTKLL